MKKTTFLITMIILASMAMAQNNNGEIEQTGIENKATLSQFGKNTSIINQLGDKNSATVEQGDEGRPVKNIDTESWRHGAFIDQIGNNNEAEIKIWKGDGSQQSGGGSNGARIEQTGNYNKAFQNISNSHVKTTNWDRMGAHIKQLGNENFAKQEVFRSFGTHGSGGIIIDQQGDANHAHQYVIGGRNNVTETYQTGNNNNYTGFTNSDVSDILNLSWSFKPVGENFSQFQRGENNALRLNIVGDNNITAQYQEGDVWGRSYNSANINVEGDYNEVAQAQLGTRNEADIKVFGDSNKAGIQQVGTNNMAEIFQQGNLNFGIITSAGAGNAGRINQTGSMNTGMIFQNSF